MKGLDLPRGPLTVVALGAHPDDIEIGCGGTLLSLADRGDVSAAHLTLTGTADRSREALSAAAAFSPGSFAECAQLQDGRLPQQWQEVKAILHHWQTLFPVPHLVFAPRHDDAHQDHALLGSLVSTVWRDSMILHYEIPKWDGDMGRPNVYVDISPDAARRKVNLLNDNFPSQQPHDWWDDELFTSMLRIRGMEIHSRYAEGFSLAKAQLLL